ncbi:MAG: hypothetical protein GY723_10035 [bacterium]|nr:hypothetical protein [bacterium]MCP5070683.1 hypothetical protein [bacterium]
MSLRIGLLVIALLAPTSLALAGDWSEADSAHWKVTLDEAHDALLAARQQLSQAEYAYQDWRQRHRPRGAKKADLVSGIEEAKANLADAEERWPEVLEMARQAGAPPGFLRRYEFPASP